MSSGKWKISADYTYLNSEAGTGFTTASSGFGGTIGKIYGTGRFNYLLEIAGNYISGTETLIDDGASKSLDVNGAILETRLGGRLNLGKRLYFCGHGLINYAYMKLPSDGAYTTLLQTDNGFGFGWAAGGGVLMKLGKRDYYLEGKYRTSKFNLFGQSQFAATGFGVAMGVEL